ncbi:serine/threonine-protein kinase [Grosmannia clavigera kw1407]|uniref:non-specific serine/threonine protein kinase n=1 Tax=Grosmannia clavigera (strain kw1407 / UAMH 11150) TaxID=655863 RepID=F0XS18_GROCL|nr:serine/threonine-protein kinase [Grosmannia clavigera kw1407]EFW99485.1 serine/threonine-protein kinase [Grosmannia clavigera kw1407]
MANALLDVVYSFGHCLSCFPSSPTLKINSRSFKILRLLGEGGFSYVYLVQDTTTAELFALKKIRCPFGAESVAQAMREVEAYRLLARADGIIHSIDYAVATERGGGGGGGIGDNGGGPAKTVYIVLPYYRRGNLQDLINANLVNHTQFPEKHLMQLFLGVCHALRAMHVYQGGPSTSAERMVVPGSNSNSNGNDSSNSRNTAEQNQRVSAAHAAASSGADDEDESAQQQPLMAEETRVGRGKSYAHRDIKPGNIMIADDGTTPILMDLGSIAESPLAITSRSLAIATQDIAAEHSTMPYRAPELFDVKTGAVIDTKVDIWSLGCTLYACLVGKSPFELRSDETGGSLAICVLSGDWRFPDEGPGGKKKQRPPQRSNTAASQTASAAPPPAHIDAVVSDSVRDVVRRCLAVEPAERPDIDDLIRLVEAVIRDLPSDRA